MNRRHLSGLLAVLLLADGCQAPTATIPSPRPASSPTSAAVPTLRTPRAPGSRFEPFSLERDGEGIVLEAVDVPAGPYRYDWTAVGSCAYEVRLGKRTVGQDAPTWLVEIEMQPGRDSGNGVFTLAEAAEILELSGTGCAFTFALESQA